MDQFFVTKVCQNCFGCQICLKKYIKACKWVKINITSFFLISFISLRPYSVVWNWACHKKAGPLDSILDQLCSEYQTYILFRHSSSNDGNTHYLGRYHRKQRYETVSINGRCCWEVCHRNRCKSFRIGEQNGRLFSKVYKAKAYQCWLEKEIKFIIIMFY